MVSRDLTRVLNDKYANEPETQAYLDQLHTLSFVGSCLLSQIDHFRESHLSNQ